MNRKTSLALAIFLMSVATALVWLSWNHSNSMAAVGQVLGSLFTGLALIWAGLAFYAQRDQLRLMREDRLLAIAQPVSAWIENLGKGQGPERAFVIRNASVVAIYDVEAVVGPLVKREGELRFAGTDQFSASGRSIFPWEPGFSAVWQQLPELFEHVGLESIGIEIAFTAGGRRWRLDLHGELHPVGREYRLVEEASSEVIDLRELPALGGTFSTWGTAPIR